MDYISLVTPQSITMNTHPLLPYILTLVCSSYSLYVYDCAADGLNVTSLSLLDVELCPEYKTIDVIDDLDIQVLQQRETYDVHVHRCSIHYKYFVTHCGMHSHVSRVRSGEGTGLWPLTASECQEIHRTRQATIMGKHLIDLKLNSSDVRTYAIGGSSQMDGSCKGSTVTIGDNTWEEAYATVEVSIVLSDFTATQRLADNALITNNGIRCTFTDGSCMDVELGFLCWSTEKRTKCDRSTYHVLYSGKAQRITVTEQSTNAVKYVMYSVKTSGFLATLLKNSPIEVCGMQMFTTDHTKLLVQEVSNGIKFFSDTPINVRDMDLFLYVNAKFTHLEAHTRSELTKMYAMLMKETCETKRQTMKNLLTIATIDPVEFAFAYMERPGYTALLMGEAINIVQCKPVYVTHAKVENCYLELPVNYSGKVYYMSPKSHILQKTGTPLTCSMFMRPLYRLENHWFSSANSLVLTQTPSKISITQGLTWEYTDAGDLAKAGIYSESDIASLRSQIMYPSERKAISQTISAAINQDSVISDTMFFKNLITKEALEESVTSFFGTTWSHFVAIGSFFSGIFGIMLILKLTKIFFDTVVNTRGLYEVYGFGWRLLAGIWDAATTYLLSPHRVYKHTIGKDGKSMGKNPPPYNEEIYHQPGDKGELPLNDPVYPRLLETVTVSVPNSSTAVIPSVDEATSILPPEKRRARIDISKFKM